MQTLEPDDTRIQFNNAFKRFSKLMDVVMPDPMANPYKEDLECLSTIYGKSKERYRDESMNLDGCGKKVRDLIHKHIRASGIEILNDEPVSIMDETEFDTRLERLESDKARASEMQQAVKHEISVRHDEDPVQYGSLQERVEELIEEYRQERLNEREIIKRLENVMDEMRSRDRVARSKGLDGETELSFYHALEDMLDTEDRSVNEETLVSLTADIVDTIEDRATVVEWKQKHHIQQQMRKRVKLQLYKSNLDLSGRERDELTNRILSAMRRSSMPVSPSQTMHSCATCSSRLGSPIRWHC